MSKSRPSKLKTGAVTWEAQERWRARVRKEDASRAGAQRGEFNIHTSVRAPGVPMKFKVLHVTPAEALASTEAGPDLSASVAKDLRAALSSQAAAPRERLLWPETSQQNIGWLMNVKTSTVNSPALPMADRGTLAGVPPRSGLGWLGGHSPAQRVAELEAHRAQKECPAAHLPAVPRSSRFAGGNGGANATAEEFAPVLPKALRGPPEPRDISPVAPVDQVLQDVARVACRITNKKRRQRRVFQNVVSFAPPPSPGAPPNATTHILPAVPTASAEEPGTLRRRPTRPTTSYQDAVESVVERSRKFLNGAANAWYKPVAASDVAEFADRYVKSWGNGPFNRA